MNTTEYTMQKLNSFKVILNKKLEEILNKNDFSNEILISLILNTLKKSYYLLGKEKIKTNNSSNDLLVNDKFLRKTNSVSQLYLQSESDASDAEKTFINNNNGSYDGSVIEDSLNLALKFLMIPKNININQNERKEKNEDKNAKILFLLSKNNNTPKIPKKDEKVGSRRDEISINCMNIIYKFMEEPIIYENKSQQTKSVKFLLSLFYIKLP